MHHLDTNIIVECLRSNKPITDRVDALLPHVAISAIVEGELLFGARVSKRPAENEKRLRAMLRPFQVVVFDQSCADAYANIRVGLRRAGRPCGESDMVIAATAVANGATLVTRDVKHFPAMPNLTFEHWTD